MFQRAKLNTVGVGHTIKVVESEICEGFIQCGFNITVPRAPQFARNLHRTSIPRTKARTSTTHKDLGARHARAANTLAHLLLVPVSPTNRSAPNNGIVQRYTYHAQSTCLYPASLSAYSTACTTSSGFAAGARPAFVTPRERSVDRACLTGRPRSQR